MMRIKRCYANRWLIVTLTITLLGLMSACPSAVWAATANLEWVRHIGTGEVDIANAVSSDPVGNVFVAGGTFGVLGISNVGEGDAFLSKYNAAGDLQWTRQFGSLLGDEAFGVSADSRGGAFVAGYTGANPNGIGNSDAFVRRYDTAGNMEWGQLLVTVQDDYAQGVSVDEQASRLYVVGHTRGSLGNTNSGALDAFLVQYDLDGNFQWSRQVGTPLLDYGNAAAADGLGNVYLTGFTFGSLEGSNSGLEDAYLAKYNSFGELQWIRQFGTSDPDRSLGVSADSLGNVFVTGNTSGELDGTAFGSADIFVRKFDDMGAVQWTRQIGTSASDTGRGVIADGLGNVYFSGITSGVLGEESAGSGDVVIGKLNSQGEIQWVSQFGSAGFDGAFGISYDGQGQVYAAGFTTGDFGGAFEGKSDGFVLRVREIPEPGSWAMVLVLLLQCACCRATRWTISK